MNQSSLRYSRLVSHVFAAFLICLLSPSAIAGEERVTVLAGVTVIDASGRAPQENVNIVISGNRIVRISSDIPQSVRSRAGVRILNLPGKYVLPGLWNNHSHLGDLLPDPKNTLDNEPVLRASIRAGRNAMDALRAGFTSLRVVGERDYIDVAWKEAFDSGVFVGPRIYPSGAPITDAESDDWLSEAVSGPDEARRAVRDRAANGVEIIKIIADNMSRDEIGAAVNEAHKHGLRITAHSGDDKSHIAVEFGVDGIEHGNSLRDETIQLMVEKNVFLDPTIVCNLSADFIAEREQLIASAGYEYEQSVVDGRVFVSYGDERSSRQAVIARETLVKAANAGVKIISGSDSNPIDEIGILEIEQLVFSGLTAMQAIQAATINSAQMMGVQDDLGTVEAGKLADLIVLNRNPLENISHLRSISMVMKDGFLVNRETNEGRRSFWDLYFLTD